VTDIRRGNLYEMLLLVSYHRRENNKLYCYYIPLRVFIYYILITNYTNHAITTTIAARGI